MPCFGMVYVIEKSIILTSRVDWMQTIPLSEEGKTKELQHILETARINGYKERTIQAIIDSCDHFLQVESSTRH